MNTDSKVISDVDRLQKHLNSDYDDTLNKVRTKSMAFLILVLCKVQDVSLLRNFGQPVCGIEVSSKLKRYFTRTILI